MGQEHILNQTQTERIEQDPIKIDSNERKVCCELWEIY